MSEPSEALFSYGTLQLDHVQRKLFGRPLDGRPDMLTGYAVGTIETRDPAAVAASGMATHLSLHADPAAPAIDGMLYGLSAAELAVADDYEGADYRRVAATFGSGRRGWVYIAA